MSTSEILDKRMPSLTEWLEKIGHHDAETFRAEDNAKRDRLEVLYQTIGIHYDRPERVLARDIVDNTPIFKEILNQKGDQACALRLIPIDPALPKLRVRGKTLRENLVWFYEQTIDPDKYRVEIIPHPDETPYSAIFLVNDNGVFGEIVSGRHSQLTQGVHDYKPVTFTYNFTEWQLSEPDNKIYEVARAALNAIQINDQTIQEKLKTELQSEFTSSNHLKGYFEFVTLPSGKIQFIDYNRLLYHILRDANAKVTTNRGDLKGICASPGTARGKVRIVLDPSTTEFNDGEILVCPMTMVEYLPLMLRAAAIVTDQGNILSHAGIVSRELHKPCVVGTKNATTVLHDGDEVEVRANEGQIIVIQNTQI